MPSICLTASLFCVTLQILKSIGLCSTLIPFEINFLVMLPAGPDVNAEFVDQLKSIFSCHPSENLHLTSTENAFCNLRKISECIDRRDYELEIVNIFQSDHFISYYENCLELLVSGNQSKAISDLTSPFFCHFLKLHTLIWGVCISKSKWSHRVCRKLAAVSIHKTLWQLVSRRELVVSICVRDKRARQLVYISFIILTTFLKRGLVSVYNYRRYNAFHILTPFVTELRVPGTKRRADDLKTAAILLLIPIVNVKENVDINNVENYVVYILNAVRYAIKSPNFYSAVHRHHLMDLCRGLTRLSRFDANKKILFECGVLQDISQMLRIPSRETFDVDDLASNAIKLLWQLCFLSECRDHLLQERSLLDLCHEIGESDRSEKCIKASWGLFWTLTKARTDAEMANDINASSLTSTPNSQGHIVFASTRANHHIVSILKKELRISGYNVYEETNTERKLACFVYSSI